MMKATTQQAAGFKPIEILITIETQKELEFLYNLFNISGEAMSIYLNKVVGSNHFEPVECMNIETPIWQELHKHL